MKPAVKVHFRGLDELKELLETAQVQIVELEETLYRISNSEVSITFEQIPNRKEN